MLLTFSIAVLFSAAPQGRIVLVAPLEAQGATPVQLATARDAVLLELKAQGYDARAEELGKPKDAAASVGGAVIILGASSAIMLRLRELGSNVILAATTVRYSSPEKLADAAKEAAAQLARESREKWGVRTRFKAPAR